MQPLCSNPLARRVSGVTRSWTVHSSWTIRSSAAENPSTRGTHRERAEWRGDLFHRVCPCGHRWVEGCTQPPDDCAWMRSAIFGGRHHQRGNALATASRLNAGAAFSAASYPMDMRATATATGVPPWRPLRRKGFRERSQRPVMPPPRAVAGALCPGGCRDTASQDALMRGIEIAACDTLMKSAGVRSVFGRSDIWPSRWRPLWAALGALPLTVLLLGSAAVLGGCGGTKQPSPTLPSAALHAAASDAARAGLPHPARRHAEGRLPLPAGERHGPGRATRRAHLARRGG